MINSRQFQCARQSILLVAVLLTAAIGTIFGFAGSAAAQSEKSTLKKVLERGHLIVGVRSTIQGFGYKNEKGELEGFDIDLSREIARGLFGDPTKVKFEILPSGKDRVPALVSGRVDMVVSLFSVFEERAQVVGFTMPYCNASLSFIVKAESVYKKNSDLNGRLIAARQGAELEKLVRKVAPEATTQEYANESDAFLAFKQGRAEAMFGDDSTALVLSRNEPGKYRVIVDPDNPVDANQYSIGVRLEDQIWLNYLNWALVRLNLTGKLKEIHKKWLGTTDVMPNWARMPY
ncbi:MAG TPA: transporter substrate-binding domain-containing protein [Hyphomicrobiaceae bacterium]|jgi:ABC-type amino acid transport substrate-binding protein|nr:transporter substrate-binding domain-containing protein [Hyphomicrobiaceae bacterium]